MNIYEFFACFTELPIRIDDIRDQALEYGVVDEFQFIPVDIDSTKLMGVHRLYKETRAYGEVHKVAQIYLAASIEDEAVRRLVSCKEILHVFDDDEHTAKTLAAVERLIDQIVVPPSSGISASTQSDNSGMLHALMILMPRDALAILKPMYELGQISAEDVARLADIPEAYARLALSPLWQMIVESIE